jgi:hypothetical protein
LNLKSFIEIETEGVKGLVVKMDYKVTYHGLLDRKIEEGKREGGRSIPTKHKGRGRAPKHKICGDGTQKSLL